MRLSIFTTVSHDRGDTFVDSMRCYSELADEIMVVDGAGAIYKKTSAAEYSYYNASPEWKNEFDWPFIGLQFQRGYEACTGDVVIHADLDFIFHENSFDDIRRVAQQMLDNNLPAMSFYKYQFVLPDRYNLKSRLVIMVNKRDFGDRIRFDGGGESDLCQPSLDGKLIRPDQVPDSKIGFWNYEKLIKSKEQIMDDVGRMERAYKRHYGHTQYGSDGTNGNAFEYWVKAQVGKFNKPQEHVPLEAHPKYVQETIKNLLPVQWGYNGLGNLEVNDYART